jgi:fumarate hydratase, class I
LEGVFLERLENDAAQFLPEVYDEHLSDDDVVRVDLSRPMADIRAELSRHPVKTRLVAVGAAGCRVRHRPCEDRRSTGRGRPMPSYLRDHAVYYAGPAKKPAGFASGSFGPTTAGRMDSYVERFQAAGGSFVMLAKGNRSKQVTEACQRYGRFYLGSIGGPAASSLGSAGGSRATQQIGPVVAAVA